MRINNKKLKRLLINRLVVLQFLHRCTYFAVLWHSQTRKLYLIVTLFKRILCECVVRGIGSSQKIVTDAEKQGQRRHVLPPRERIKLQDSSEAAFGYNTKFVQER